MYTDFWKKWHDYSGKTSRKIFWKVTLINTILTILIISIQLAHTASKYVQGTNIHWLEPQTYTVLLIWILLLTIPSVSMIARRYNDAGVPKTGLTIALTIEITLVIAGLFITFIIFKNFSLYTNFDINQIVMNKAGRLVRGIYKSLAFVIVFINAYLFIVLVSPNNVQARMADKKNNVR